MITSRILAATTVGCLVFAGATNGVFGSFSMFQITGKTCTGNIYWYDYGYGYGYGYDCLDPVSNGGWGGSTGGNGIVLTPTSTPTPAPVVGSSTWVIVPRARDIARSEYKDSIETLIEKWFVKNTVKFFPERSITRAEFVKILSNAYGYSTKKAKKRFLDVNYSSDLAQYINFWVALGWINIRHDYFRPNDSITRGEAQKLVDVISWNASADTVAEPTAFITRGEAADLIVKSLLNK